MSFSSLAFPPRDIGFKAYEAAPGLSALILPDAPKFTYVLVSNDYVRMSGRKREEVIGKGHFDLYPKNPNDHHFTGEQNVRASFEYVIRHKAPHEIAVQRYDVPAGDGQFKEKYWKINNAPVLSDEGDVLFIVHSVLDITEQVLTKQREQTLKGVEKLNEELSFIMNFMPQMVWITLADGSAEFFNQEYLDYTGLTIDQLAGHQWMALVHPQDVELTSRLWQQALASGSSYTVEHRLRGSDDTYRWFLTRARAMRNNEGVILKWYGTTTDIQETKELNVALDYRNMLFRTMTDNATSTLFMMDKSGYCTFMNAAGEKMFGYTQEEIRQKPLHYLIHHHRPDGSFYPMEECPIDRALPENYDVRAHRDLFFRKDGSSLPVTCAASPIFNNGVPISTVIEVRDITLELEAEQALRRSTKELEKLVDARTEELQAVNEQLKQFAYAASHDLQEPLRKITFFIERLHDHAGASLDESNRQIIYRIQSTVGRMRGLINDILDYSNATMGRTSFKEVDTNKLVAEVVSDMEATIIEKEAELDIGELPPVKGDERQLRQLFHNLLSNALKYNRPGEPPRVSVSCGIVNGQDTLPPAEGEDDKPFYLFEVRDSGIGFEQEYADKIFQVFQRLHGKKEYEGTGVGLAIVKKVAENHGGRIWAESVPGEGATFKVMLPRG